MSWPSYVSRPNPGSSRDITVMATRVARYVLFLKPLSLHVMFTLERAGVLYNNRPEHRLHCR